MGNSSSVVFPQPVMSADATFPNWAIATVVAAVIVTLLWVVAIIVLILYEIIANGQQKSVSTSSVITNQHATHGAGSSVSAVGTEVLSENSGPPVSPPVLPQAAASSLSLETPSATADNRSRGTEEKLKVNIVQINAEDLCNDSSCVKSDLAKPDVVSHEEGTTSVEGATNIEEGASHDHENLLSGMVLSRPVTVRQLGATIREPGYIETEFRKLPNVKISSNDLPIGTDRKNRYTNVLPTPRTRVELPQMFGHPNSNYINANYIRGYQGISRQYIATQGPLQSTIEDFWRMILDNNTSTIIMATNFQERGIEKCTRYWPAQGSEEYGSVQVTLLQQTAHSTHNTSVLQVQAAGQVARIVTHYRLTFWPLQGVPQDTKIVTNFLKMVKMADGSGPAVVHCSSGIGRTGVLLACDIGLQAFLQGDPKVDVLRIVSTLRQDRAGMIQTREQYRFIHQALYNFIKEEYAK